MSSWPVRTLEDAQRVDPVLGEVLRSASLDFFDPPSRNVSWEAERAPLTGGRDVALVASQPVSRAWHAVFIKAFHAAAHERYGRSGQWPAYEMTKQVPEPGPVDLVVELGRSEEDRREVVHLVKVATETANALVSEAAENCLREHQDLARKLGLARPPVGF